MKARVISSSVGPDVSSASVTIEELLKASGEATVESVMDRDARVVAPGVDQELAAWHAVRRGESALAVVDRDGRFVGVIPPYRLLAVYLADAVGTQTETVIVRGLSLGVPMRRMVAREVVAGIVIGLVLASIAGPLVFWHWGDSRLALSVGVSVLAASSTATGAAMALPWVFDSLTLDPAFGSGPLATVIQDLLSIWIFLRVTALTM